MSLLFLGLLFGVVVWRLLKQLVCYIAERDNVQQILFQEKELAQVTLHSIGDAVITTNAEGRSESLNLEVWDRCQTEGGQCLYTINLSGASINDDEFVDFVREQFTQYQITPKVICFEITETVAIANLTKAVEFIQELKMLGCRFALDDFGSGMSSFAYLKNLPVDYLKIDGDFVKDIIHNPTSLAMVQAMNRIGYTMNIQTIALVCRERRYLRASRCPWCRLCTGLRHC